MFPSLLISHFRSPSLRRTLLPLALAAALAACADHAAPLDPQARAEPFSAVEVQTLTCTADVRSGTVSCTPPGEAEGPPGGLSRIVLNPEGRFVRFVTSNINYTNEIYTFDATVQNLAPQTLGIATNGRYDGNGVRVFFSQLPVATEGTGNITVNGAETGKITRAGQLFYRYSQTLATNETSQAREWSFSVPETVIRFTFSVLVAGSVQYPHGWIEITGAPTLQVPRNGTFSLTAVVRDALGRDITGSVPPVAWSVADASIATLSGSTVTGAATAGYTTVFATTQMRSSNALLLVGTPLTRITAGRHHTCGLAPNGRAHCWGRNGFGELGDKTYQARHKPEPVRQGPVTLVEIDAGDFHTCALSSAGQAYCWGSNARGQLGESTTKPLHAKPLPVQQGPIRYVEITAGGQHTCARTAEGQAYCWGMNSQGQLGDNTTTNRYTPVAVQQGAVTFVEITTGGNQTCGRTSAGQSYCWGGNVNGQLGDGTTTPRRTPVVVQQGTTMYQEITAGPFHTCGTSFTGQTHCWGFNRSRQLGDSTIISRIVPVPVRQQPPFSEVSLGFGHSCGRSPAGQAYCWGRSGHYTPVAVQQQPHPFAQITSGNFHDCGRTSRGQAYCWGDNSFGQLGDNTTVSRATPVAVY